MYVDDSLFISIGNILHYRKKIAIELLKCQDEEKYKVLQNIYESSEYQLKQVLNL